VSSLARTGSEIAQVPRPAFGARLAAALDARGSVCVGIDPHAALLGSWGLPDDAEGLARFADICVAAFAGRAAVVKPQSAFFERFGAAGIAVLERTVAAAREAGALVLLDVKRGDIGSTMAAYAQAYLAPSAPLASDAITVSAYLGVGSLQPVFDLVEAHGTGAFVLAATSNPEAPQLQAAATPGGRTVAQTVVDEMAARNAGAARLGSYGVVVGATVAPGTVDVGALHGPILAPGVGAQGGTADDVRRVFGDGLAYVLPAVSREVLRHGPDVAALRDAVDRLVAEFAFLRDPAA
jgi:orotidine-5'-phosphate decarboxylase